MREVLVAAARGCGPEASSPSWPRKEATPLTSANLAAAPARFRLGVQGCGFNFLFFFGGGAGPFLPCGFRARVQGFGILGFATSVLAEQWLSCSGFYTVSPKVLQWFCNGSELDSLTFEI